MSDLDGPRVIDPAKMTGYLLNFDHPIGRSKAMFFAAAGFDANDPLSLARALGDHAAARPVVRRDRTPFGEKCLIRCELVTPNGRNPCIVAVWFRPSGGTTYRLVAAYPATAPR